MTHLRSMIPDDIQPLSDEALMSLIQQGDDAAFSELFRRYAPSLLRTLQRGVRSPDEAQDLVQTTFVQVFRARHDFDVSRTFRVWLFAIAFNQRRDHFRRERARAVSASPMLDEVPVAKNVRGEDAADGFEAQDRQEEIRVRLGALAGADREILRSHWLGQESYASIGERLGLSVSAVKMRVHRALAGVRKQAGMPSRPA